MISAHLILKAKERYPVLHSTYEGLHYSEVITEGKLKKLKKYLEEEVVVWEINAESLPGGKSVDIEKSPNH